MNDMVEVPTVMVVAVKARVAEASNFWASAVAAALRETSRRSRGTAVARPAASTVKRVETNIVVVGAKECDKDRRSSGLQRVRRSETDNKKGEGKKKNKVTKTNFLFCTQLG